MTNTKYHGVVRNGQVVLFPAVTPLREGTEVVVMPITDSSKRNGSGGGPITVSPEQRDALLRLIGIWKSDSPPSDEDVERILEEARLEKYG